jgi:hypothetical protein
MSGISTSFTFRAPTASVPKLLIALEKGEHSEFATYIENNCLQATSRNNWVEYFTHKLVKEFECRGLTHLTDAFDERRDGQMFAKDLCNDTLSSAIVGLRQLFESMKAHPARCVSALDGTYTESEVLEELEGIPSSLSLSETIARYNLYRGYNEGDDLGTLIAFLYAHLSVLQCSHENGDSAVYTLWLY